MRKILALAALVTYPAFAQLTFTINSSGVQSLVYNSRNFHMAGASFLGSYTMQTPGGSKTFYSSPASTASSDNSTYVQNVYRPSLSDSVTMKVTYSVADTQTLAVQVQVTNNDATDSVYSIQINPLDLDISTDTISTSTPQTANAQGMSTGSVGSPSMFFLGTFGSIAAWHDFANTGMQLSCNTWTTGTQRLTFTTAFSYGVSDYSGLINTYNSVIGPSASRTYNLWLRFGDTTQNQQTLAPEASTLFAGVFPFTAAGDDRRQITNWIMTSSNYRGVNNPRGYINGTVNALSPSAFATALEGQANSVVTIAKTTMQPAARGVMIWDMEGQEFNQPITYIGDPRLMAAIAPEMEDTTVHGIPEIDYVIKNILQANGLDVGATIRPQVITSTGTSLPGTCFNDPVHANYDDTFVNTTPFTYPSSTRWAYCSGTNAWTYTPNSGTGHQEQTDLQSLTAIQNNLIAKIQYCIQRWGMKFFYIDSTLYVNGGPYDMTLWKTLSQTFPGIQFFPEQTIMGDGPYISSYTDIANLGVKSGASARLNYPATYRFDVSNNGVTSGDQAAIQAGAQHGDIYSNTGWFNDGSITLLNSIMTAAAAGNSTVVFTDSSTGAIRSISANPFTDYKYPLVARVYFAANSGAMAASTTYCTNIGGTTCYLSGVSTGGSTINLSGMTVYAVRYYTFNGVKVSEGTTETLSTPVAPPLVVTSALNENFDTTVPTSQWTINSDATTSPGPALSWYSTGGNPGFRLNNYGQGTASTPWPVGTGNFNLSFSQSFSSGNGPSSAFPSQENAGIVTLNGGSGCVSTDPAGSLSMTSISICYTFTQAGPTIEVRQGIPYYLQMSGTVTGGNTYTRTNGDSILPGIVGQQFMLRQNNSTVDTGPYTITATNGCTTTCTSLTFSGGSSGLNNSSVSLRGDTNLAQSLSGPLGVSPTFFPWNSYGNTNSGWFAGQALSVNPQMTINIIRSGNQITWNVYTNPMTPLGTLATGIQGALQLDGGATPIGVNQLVNFIGGNTFTLTGTAATASLSYVNVFNVNANRTGWLGGSTVCTGGNQSTCPNGTPVAPSTASVVSTISNFHGYGTITSGTIPTITSVLPTATSGTSNLIAGGNSVTVRGANFHTGSTVRIGIGANLVTASATGSGSSLTFTAPAMSAGTYKFSVVDPAGVDIPFLSGITYSSAPTISSINPHEFGLAGGEQVTINGTGFDSGTTVTFAGANCTSVSIVNSQQLTCITPAGTQGVPAVVLTSGAGTFTSLSTDTALLKGYAGHPYLQFNSSGLTALQDKWTNPTYADYTVPVKRDISTVAILTSIVGTFNVQDTITQGAVSGISYGLQYGASPSFLVIYPTAGSFAAGAITDTTTGATATVVAMGTLQGMIQSFTASCAGATGSFSPGDIVTQGINSAEVFSWNAGTSTIGLMPVAGTMGILGGSQTLTGPSGSCSLSTSLTRLSPNDNAKGSLGAWNTGSWQNKNWYDIASGSTKFASEIWTGTSQLNFTDGLNLELKRINWMDAWDQYFSLEGTAADVALFYDANFASMSQTQRTQVLTYLDRVRTLCNQLNSANDVFIKPTSTFWNNWMAVSNGSCIQVNMAEFYSVTRAATDAPNFVNNVRGVSPSYTNGYANREIDPDGVILEGSQYSGFGLGPYLKAGRACLNTLGTDTCGATGTGLLNMPHLLLNSTQTDLTIDGTGGWQVFNDTQPQHYNTHLMADLCDRLTNPTLCYVGDTMAHIIATENPYTGELAWGVTRFDYGPWALLWRSGTTASFGGFSTARCGSGTTTCTAAAAYGVLRSSTAYTPSLVVGIKGQSADQSINGHREADAGSFVVQSQGEWKLGDPGYFQPAASAHSIFSVDGNSVGNNNAALVTAFDSSLIDLPNNFGAGVGKESIALDLHAVFSAGVTQARRTYSTYGAKAVLVLDDIIASGTGNVASLFQGFNTTTSSTAGFNIVGANSTLACTFHGPTMTTVTQTGPLGFGLSWIYNNLGTKWYTVTANYGGQNVNTNPLVTVCIDSVGGAGLTVSSFTNTGTVITVGFSDGTNYVYNLTGGKWMLQ